MDKLHCKKTGEWAIVLPHCIICVSHGKQTLSHFEEKENIKYTTSHTSVMSKKHHTYLFVGVTKSAWDWLMDNDRYLIYINSISTKKPYDLPYYEECEWMKKEMRKFEDPRLREKYLR